MRYIFGLLTFLVAQVALAQVPFPPLQQPIQTFSYEDKDWQVEAPSSAKRPPYHAPTPTTIPGGRVIKTSELKALLASRQDIMVIDVLDSKARTTVPGAYWMSGAGEGQFYAAEKTRSLEKLTSGDKARPLVFMCLNSECWLSYNASVHATEAGYTDVIWYRGGTGAWRGASQELRKPQALSW